MNDAATAKIMNDYFGSEFTSQRKTQRMDPN